MKKRIGYIEWLRVICMTAVVLNHIGATAEVTFPDTYFAAWGGVLLGSVDWLSHFAVPIFFMMTGALLLNPNKEITLNKLFGKYIFKYAADILIFGWLFALMEEMFTNKTFTVKYIANSFLNTVGGNTWSHMWYLYTLLGILFVLPMLRAIVRILPKKEYRYILMILFASLSVIQYIEHVTGTHFGIHLPIDSIYVFYMLAGHWIDSEEKKVKDSVLHIVVAVCCIFLLIGSYLRIRIIYDTKIGAYYSPIIALYSMSIYALANSSKYFKNTNKVIEILSTVSFGVYLIHMVFINFLFKFLRIDPMSLFGITGVLMAAGILIISVVIVLIMKKIPFVRQLV